MAVSLVDVVISMWDTRVAHLSMGNVSFSPSHVGTAILVIQNVMLPTAQVNIAQRTQSMSCIIMFLS